MVDLTIRDTLREETAVGFRLIKTRTSILLMLALNQCADLLQAHMGSLGGNWQIRGQEITFSVSFFIYIQHLNESRRVCMGDLELLDIENIIVSSSSHACQIAGQMHLLAYLL